jgi:hypothetical protein
LLPRHIFSFLGLSIVPTALLVQYPTLGPLQVLPPYVAVSALLALVVELRDPKPGRQPPNDEERGNGSMELEDRSQPRHQNAGLNTGHEHSDADPSGGLARRNSFPSHNILPDPSAFAIGDDSSDNASSHITSDTSVHRQEHIEHFTAGASVP